MLVYAALPIENYRRMGHGMGQRISYKNRLTFSSTKRRKSPENDSFQEIFALRQHFRCRHPKNQIFILIPAI